MATKKNLEFKEGIVLPLLIFLFVMIVLPISYATDNQTISRESNVSLQLISNKNIYNVGDNVNLTLNITNKNNYSINGRLSGRIIIGDVGINIKCYELSLKPNETRTIQFSPIPATLSKSNRKMTNSIYYCNGVSMNSVETFFTNKLLPQNGTENDILGPLEFNFTKNGINYTEKSNILNLTIVAGTNTQQSNNMQSQSNSQSTSSQSTSQSSSNTQSTSGSQSQQNSQTSNFNNNGGQQNNNLKNTLSQSQQRALTNNQANSQSVSALKKEIENENNNIMSRIKNDDSSSFWIWLLILVVISLGLSYIYYIRNIKVEDNENNSKEEFINIEPEYITYLNKIDPKNTLKENAFYIVNTLRFFIKEKFGVDKVLTNKEIENYFHDDKIKEYLEKCELIEFANKNVKLDVLEVKHYLKNKLKLTLKNNKEVLEK
jgi:hypothetical protein